MASDPARLTLSTCTVEVEVNPNSVTVSVAGELDMADSDRVGELLIEAAASGRPIVRLQLSGLTFADSSAIKAILVGARAAEDHGVTYELVNPHGRVQRLLHVTGLVNALTIVVEPDDEQGPHSL
ncbi:MAG: STAS domain-containing protein [Ilumatobacteraceae bacterium]